MSSSLKRIQGAASDDELINVIRMLTGGCGSVMEDDDARLVGKVVHNACGEGQEINVIVGILDAAEKDGVSPLELLSAAHQEFEAIRRRKEGR